MSLGNSTEPYFCQLCYENIFPFQKMDNDTFYELFADINTKAFFLAKSTDHDKLTANQQFRYSDFVTDFVTK